MAANFGNAGSIFRRSVKVGGCRTSRCSALGSGMAHVRKIPEQTDKFTGRPQRESVVLTEGYKTVSYGYRIERVHQTLSVILMEGLLS
jgi:hypothetical protein